MSTVTTRLGLTKPAGIEQFNLATYNNNLDLIDTYVSGTADKLAKGVLSTKVYDSSTSVGLGSSQVMCNYVAVSLVAGRRYVLHYEYNLVCLAEANIAVGVFFKKSVTTDTTSAGTGMADSMVHYSAPQAGNGKTHHASRVWDCTTTETVNFKAVMQRLVGSNTFDISSRYLWIEDLGAQ